MNGKVRDIQVCACCEAMYEFRREVLGNPSVGFCPDCVHHGEGAES